MAIEIAFAGQQYLLTSDRIQILDLLLASFETAVRKNIELEEANRQLRLAVQTIDKLGEMIPICCHCKKIRNDKGFWQQLESYCLEHSIAEFTHGLCPDCEKELYPELHKQNS
jgi:hypothetical protein